jgi:hypothetical protein
VRPIAQDELGGANASDRDPNDRRFGGREPEDEEFDPNTGPASDLSALEAAATTQSAGLPTSVLVMGGLTVLLLLVAGGGFLAMAWYEQRGTPRQASGGTWAFARLAHMTRWLRLKMSTADTPYEQARSIGLAVPKRRDEIEQLADIYVRERYGRAEVDPAQTRSIWRRIHWSLWGAGVKRRLPSVRAIPQKLWRRSRR